MIWETLLTLVAARCCDMLSVEELKMLLDDMQQKAGSAEAQAGICLENHVMAVSLS